MTGARRALFLLCRAGFAAFFFLSAIYGLIAYNPFTYQQIIRFELVPWLIDFARLQPWLYWVAQGLAIATLVPDLRRRRRAAIAYAAAAVAAGVALAAHPVLATLGNDDASLLWGVIALLPIFALAAVDHLAARGRLTMVAIELRHARRLFWASLLAALYVFSVYSILYALRAGPDAADLDPLAQVLVSVTSLALHLVVFMGGFLAFLVARGVAGLSRRPAFAELWAGAFLVWVLMTMFLESRVLAAISMSGEAALGIAAALSAAAVVSLSGLAVRVALPGAAGGAAMLLAPLALFPGARSPYAQALALAGLAAAAGGALAGTATLDWNGLLAQLSALLVWAIAFATLLARPPRARPGASEPTLRLVIASLLILAGYRALAERVSTYTDPAAEKTVDVNGALTRYAGFEPSFRLLHEALQARHDDGALFELLQASTNIAADVAIAPIDVKLSPELRATPGRKPDIFVFVIDSLRRDYLSPYNDAVGFTPEIAAFAARSHVFASAFTHYGATGLSQPSIWVGGMMPHKQYITPFRPLNALEKLLEAEGYDRLIGVDTILTVLLDGAPGIEPLDAKVANKDYDLCGTLEELQGKLAARGEARRPVFAYSQPQNIHISRIEREGKSVPPGFESPGFYPPYASRLQRIDACFGAFVRFLEARGLLDDSVIVLTADHGDSLGEEGRWGHAYTIYPEIIRIPLIVHLPPALAAGWTTDTRRTVFSTDITPTLYALLGHPPAATSDVFGRPLFWREGAAPPRTREWQLIASSYGPVYGVLEGASRLYIADGVNYAQSYWDLTTGAAGSRIDFGADVAAENQQRIRDAIAELHRVYQVPALR